MTKGSTMLKQFRADNGLTHGDIERATGVPRSTIACIESVETYTTSVQTAKKLGEYIRVPWCLFFENGGDDADATNG